jgi:RNA polymerase sigma factor (sigma-70 family)
MLSHIRRLAARRAAPPNTDASLLERFVHRRDEVAFALLVERYGGLVSSVCRRVLGDAAAAQDCMQATFLVLARKAGAIRRPGELPAWLHGTAYRLALRTRRADLRRLKRETRFAQVARRKTPVDPLDELTARELLGVLDEELERLPEVYRLPVILCGLEGLSQEEAAVRLGWTSGSVKGRLERARARLHVRLKRRGLALTTALGAVEMARAATAATPSPIAVAGQTARFALAFVAGRSAVNDVLSPVAVALAEGALKAMYLSKLKTAMAVVVVLGLAGAGFGWLGSGPGNDPVAGMPSAAAADGGARPGPARAGTDRDDSKKRAELLAHVKKELQRYSEEAEDRDQLLSNKVVEARERLLELEERLRTSEMERKAPLPGLEETMVSVKVNSLATQIDEVKLRARPDDLPRLLGPLQKQREEVQKRLDVLREKRAEARARSTAELLALRKQIIREDEGLRRLERKRDSAREEAERRRESLADRLRRLEVGEDAVPRSDRPMRALERRLKAIESEIGELRQEIRRLRTSGKGG